MKRKTLIILLLLVMTLSIAIVACDNVDGFETTPYTGSSKFKNEIVLDTNIPAKASEPTLQIHYYRANSDDYLNWHFWVWLDGGSGKAYELNYQDDFGAIALIGLSEISGATETSRLGLIPHLPPNFEKDCNLDRFFNLSDFVKDDNNYYHLYLVQGDEGIYKQNDSQLEAKKNDMRYGVTASFVNETQISISAESPISYVKILEGTTVLAERAVTNTALIKYNLQAGKQVDFNKNYAVEVTFDGDKVVACDVSIHTLYATEGFQNAYYYDGELGAIYSKASTTFRVWSPVSSVIELNIYQSGHENETPSKSTMVKGDKGVFEYTLSGDLGGKYYTYTVFNMAYPNGREIVDPYAKSAGLSGVRGQIVDFSKTNPTGWENVQPLTYDRKELVIWETHVSDVTSSDTWNGSEQFRKKFLGLTETGTTYTQGGVTVKTGFDHIKELGVNAIQFVPIYDQANDESKMVFNWGYNPLNYNVLEGSYSTDPTDGYNRIREFKEVVKAYTDAGITIIMDVVYNHVSSAIGSNFDVLMPGYYFRYTDKGALSNGSGCGNETASENKMFQKFIIDSVCFWAEEYKLGGYRFDLMGLHDIDTMNLVEQEVRKINPNIVIFGEPWTAGGSTLPKEKQSVQKNGNELYAVGQFNDQMRDALIKGGLNPDNALGWVTATSGLNQEDVERILSGLKGITQGDGYMIDANRTVNYVTCHDNYTLYDRIKAAGIKDETTVKRMAVLANSVVLTSGGTAFILAGEEFLRTKGGDHNSYESSYKVNELDYALKITHADVFAIYQTLVAFKQNTAALHLNSDQLSTVNYESKYHPGGRVLEVTFIDSGRQYKIIHANGSVASYTHDFEGYTLLLDTVGGAQLSASTATSLFQTIIAYKEI